MCCQVCSETLLPAVLVVAWIAPQSSCLQTHSWPAPHHRLSRKVSFRKVYSLFISFMSNLQYLILCLHAIVKKSFISKGTEIPITLLKCLHTTAKQTALSFIHPLHTVFKILDSVLSLLLRLASETQGNYNLTYYSSLACLRLNTVERFLPLSKSDELPLSKQAGHCRPRMNPGVMPAPLAGPPLLWIVATAPCARLAPMPSQLAHQPVWHAPMEPMLTHGAHPTATTASLAPLPPTWYLPSVKSMSHGHTFLTCCFDNALES